MSSISDDDQSDALLVDAPKSKRVFQMNYKADAVQRLGARVIEFLPSLSSFFDRREDAAALKKAHLILRDAILTLSPNVDAQSAIAEASKALQYVALRNPKNDGAVQDNLVRRLCGAFMSRDLPTRDVIRLKALEQVLSELVKKNPKDPVIVQMQFSVKAELLRRITATLPKDTNLEAKNARPLRALGTGPFRELKSRVADLVKLAKGYSAQNAKLPGASFTLNQLNGLQALANHKDARTYGHELRIVAPGDSMEEEVEEQIGKGKHGTDKPTNPVSLLDALDESDTEEVGTEESDSEEVVVKKAPFDVSKMEADIAANANPSIEAILKENLEGLATRIDHIKALFDATKTAKALPALILWAKAVKDAASEREGEALLLQQMIEARGVADRDSADERGAAIAEAAEAAIIQSDADDLIEQLQARLDALQPQ
ncbi:hypothetical protein [Hydrogenophaga sp.]|uniref:hypothetical protein n=1 Tax=Hydrogenophaga sp. TaxID=1904254 RepID=UPI002716B904|nr:hypothetical protein [Hydrogenophaga sp.]MDO9437321.1 hypothetical protein [Hydrogenophaga sp.]